MRNQNFTTSFQGLQTLHQFTIASVYTDGTYKEKSRSTKKNSQSIPLRLEEQRLGSQGTTPQVSVCTACTSDHLVNRVHAMFMFKAPDKHLSPLAHRLWRLPATITPEPVLFITSPSPLDLCGVFLSPVTTPHKRQGGRGVRDLPDWTEAGGGGGVS